MNKKSKEVLTSVKKTSNMMLELMLKMQQPLKLKILKKKLDKKNYSNIWYTVDVKEIMKLMRNKRKKKKSKWWKKMKGRMKFFQIIKKKFKILKKIIYINKLRH